MKWIGALLVLAGCAGVGVYMAAMHLQEVLFIKKLICALDFMSCELQYRLTPLPELCRQAAKESSGPLKRVLIDFSHELESQICPDVNACMYAALDKSSGVPECGRQCMVLLGSSMGRFDLAGQIRSIDAVRSDCRCRLEKLEENKEVRIRSYKTLSICAGAAIVILFI